MKLRAALASRRTVAWGGALFIGVVVALEGYNVLRNYRSTVENTGRELDTQARVLAEQTARTIQAVDVQLRHLAQQYKEGSLPTHSPRDLRTYLKDYALGIVQIEGLLIVNADGSIRASSYMTPEQEAPVNLSDRYLTRTLRDDPNASLVISPTELSVVDKKWMFPLGRRLETRSNAFSGVVAARGKIEYFQDFYRDVRLDEGTKISLMRLDGTMLARYPEAEGTLGKRFPLFDELLAAHKSGEPGPSRFVSTIDGVERFGALRLVPDYPLAVVVTRDAEVALAPWRAQTWRVLAHVLLLSALAATLLAIVLRQLSRLDETRESLAQSRERFALAVAGSDDGIWDFDFTAQRAFISERAAELSGMPFEPEAQSVDEWNRRLSAHVHPEDVQRRAEALEAHLSGKTPHYEVELRHRHSDGGYRWVRVRGVCTRDEAGRPLRIAGSVSDIDARKRAEEALRQSEERFALAAAGANDGIIDWDIANGRMYTSKRALEIFGIDSDVTERSREEWDSLVRYHPDDRRRTQEGLRRFLASRDQVLRDVEYRVLLADGSPRWVRRRHICVRDADGKPLRLVGSVSDTTAQKHAEAALRESEERFALAVAGANDGIIDWDIVNDKVYASKRAMEIVGIDPAVPARTRGQWVSGINYHPEDRVVAKEDLDRFLAGREELRNVEYRVVLPGGDLRWVRHRHVCVRDPGGKALRLVGSVSDITAQKRAEEALRQSQERFALAVAGSNDGVIDWDIVNDRMYTSERTLQICGVDSKETLRTRAEWLALLRLHPKDRERHTVDLREFFAGINALREGDYRVQLADGRYRWVRVRNLCVRDAAGRPIRLAGSVSDIDAEKRAEAALRESEARYQLAVDGSNQGLWDWDLLSDKLFLSPRAQEFMGLTPGEPLRLRREWVSLSPYHPDDLESVRKAISDHVHGLTPYFTTDYRMRHPSGDWHWYRQRGIALRDDRGRAYRMAGSMEDISDYKNAELEKARLEGQLLQAKKLEAIGTLAGGIAHDFNNILSAILGYGEMAQKDAEGTPSATQLRRHIDAALSAAHRAKSLVERILAFSRSGIGERVPVHVESVVAEALDLVAASLPRGVKLERKLQAGDAAVLGDPTQIHQVVMNLCTNGIQAMKSGGALTVSLDVVEKSGGQVATSVLSGGRYLRLAVRDTGAGIPGKLLERIFDPFFTTKEVGVGTGLGLSLVHGIVTDLGGGIDVESRPGEGATFTVYLPWSSSVAAPAGVDEIVPEGSGETILLIDDEEPLVRLGEEMIAGLGYEPVGFTSSAAALQSFRDSPGRFHAVLSDEAMPEMTGSELAKEIRAIRPDIPIVLMSGFVSPALLGRARDLGVMEVLAKPLVERDIARGLANALRNGGRP